MKVLASVKFRKGSWYFSLLVALISTLAPGCATTEKTAPTQTTKVDDGGWNGYTFTNEPTVQGDMKLPAMIPISINWQKDGQTLETTRGYRGWDINLDGTIDMLEIINGDGQTIARAYDFNFDGEIDFPDASEPKVDVPVNPTH